MNNNILRILPNTYIWRHGETGLVYNSVNFKSFKFDNIGKIKDACDDLDILEKLYSVKCNFDSEKDNEFIKWINNLVEIESAELKEDDEDYIPSIKPIAQVQENFSKIRDNKNFRELLYCFREITIHLNGTKLSPSEGKYCNQVFYPSSILDELDIKLLVNFLEIISYNNYINLNIVMGNIDIIKLLKVINIARNFINLNFYVRYSDFRIQEEDIINQLLSFGTIKVLFEVNDSIRELKENLNKYKDSNIKFIAIVKSEEDILEVENYVSYNNEVEIIPVYTCDNLDFFKEFVFTTEEDILALKSDKRKISMNQLINSYFFGKLEITPDGSIWDKINVNHLGNISDKVDVILENILKSKINWFNIRNMQPCSNCIYQWLCPPPSSYESVINMPNLCVFNSAIYDK